MGLETIHALVDGGIHLVPSECAASRTLLGGVIDAGPWSRSHGRRGEASERPPRCGSQSDHGPPSNFTACGRKVSHVRATRGRSLMLSICFLTRARALRAAAKPAQHRGCGVAITIASPSPSIELRPARRRSRRLRHRDGEPQYVAPSRGRTPPRAKKYSVATDYHDVGTPASPLPRTHSGNSGNRR